MHHGELIRTARRGAGLTQTALAHRLGTTQSAVARLEDARSNPTLRTIRMALAATGHRLELALEPAQPSVDESLIRQALELSPADRIKSAERLYAEGRKLALAGARSRGELP